MGARQIGAVLLMAATLGLNSLEPARDAVPNIAAPAGTLASVLSTQREPAASGSGLEPTDMRVLLSSIDVTVSLLDVYGQCRDEDLEHEPCMAMIRSTLGHARNLIGPPAK